MPKPTVQLELSGIANDLPDYSYPPDIWTGGNNVEMQDGYAERARGYGPVLGTLGIEPYWLLNSTPPGVSYWIYAGAQAIWATNGTTHADISPLVVDWPPPGNRQIWSGGIVQGQAVMNPEGGQPLWWNNALGTPAEVLPDWPAGDQCQTLRPFREFLIAMNITRAGVQIPELLAWSDAAPPGSVPQSWTPGPQSLAGEATAAYNPGGIVDGHTLRDQFIIYKTHTTFVLQLVGGQFVFATRPLFSTIGALTRHCVVEYRGTHIVFGDGDVIRHDGVQADSIIDRTLRRAIFDGIDDQNFQNCFLAVDKQRKEIWICVPEPGGPGYPTVAVVWSIADNRFGFRELVRDEADLEGRGTRFAMAGLVSAELPEQTWAEKTTTWATDGTRWRDAGIEPIEDTMVLTDNKGPAADPGQLHALDLQADFDGRDPHARVTRTGLDFGEPDVVKTMTRIYPRISGTNGMQMRIRAGGALAADAPIYWDEFREFRVGMDAFVGVTATGKFLAVEFESDTAGRWRMPGFSVELTQRGRF